VTSNVPLAEPPVEPLVVPLAEAGAAGAQVGVGGGAGVGAGVGVVGGKGASLGELARAGIAVPPGFVVTVAAFTAAMAAADPDGTLRAGIGTLDAGDGPGIARAAADFRDVVTAAPLPGEVAAAVGAGYATLGGAFGGAFGGAVDVAVRSSATVEDSAEASFAGLQDTYLGVSGTSSVLDHVRRCWASLYNDESVAYRRRLGLPEAGVAMAVVVQRMIAPRAAGVMFTRSPVSGDRSVVAVEGVWGLGSALVSGDVTPDAWLISKVTGEITGRRISPKVKIHGHLPNDSAASPDAPLRAGLPDPEVPDPRVPDGRVPDGRVTDPSVTAAGVPNSRVTVGGLPDGGVTDPRVTDGKVAVGDTPPELRDAPCLTDDEIRALVAVARRVEAHYGAPQDIEWAILDGAEAAAARVVLLQSRPETVWAARAAAPAGVPKARAADHVLALFGKPL
jgi:pyruvate, water dikinase